MGVNFNFCNRTSAKIDKNFLTKVAQRVFQEERVQFKKRIEVDIIIVSSPEIRRLNKRYRHKDKVTDVLSFPMFGRESNFFTFAPDQPLNLGEVVISYDEAKKTAKILNYPIKQELARLLIHGILHLLGYDHKTSKEGKMMRIREEKIYKKLGFDYDSYY